ncbi:hypothetical protein M378DRAFT_172927 [Amanita muscaria Koide BX008]|uniref:Uncharacterized protein n=1 Tax=Amanita muscaria (strain Koide BX008) TaxID=946122 RepID=A0A0C2W4W1_AMAMK|nr:hypothetical protein M378DRAFT_172927 [Amanita muscaria Koide BX008]
MLNETLLHFRELELRGDEVEDGDIIFAINDPVVIEFRRLHEDCEHYPFYACVLIASTDIKHYL